MPLQCHAKARLAVGGCVTSSLHRLGVCCPNAAMPYVGKNAHCCLNAVFMSVHYRTESANRRAVASYGLTLERNLYGNTR